MLFRQFARFQVWERCPDVVLIQDMQRRPLGRILTQQLAPARHVPRGRQTCIAYQNAKARQMHDLRESGSDRRRNVDENEAVRCKSDFRSAVTVCSSTATSSPSAPAMPTDRGGGSPNCPRSRNSSSTLSGFCTPLSAHVSAGCRVEARRRLRCIEISSITQRLSLPPVATRFDRDRRGADAAAHAKNKHKPSGASPGPRGTSREDAAECLRDYRADEGLENIFGDAGAFQFAIEPNVVVIADHNDTGAGLAETLASSASRVVALDTPPISTIRRRGDALCESNSVAVSTVPGDEFDLLNGNVEIAKRLLVVSSEFRSVVKTSTVGDGPTASLAIVATDCLMIDLAPFQSGGAGNQQIVPVRECPRRQLEPLDQSMF